MCTFGLSGCRVKPRRPSLRFWGEGGGVYYPPKPQTSLRFGGGGEGEGGGGGDLLHNLKIQI